MAIRKSSVLLPSVFQTTKNNKFLNATVDQLISEPVQQRINGFVGRKYAANYNIGDGYITEMNSDRQNYQLEPAVVYKGTNKKIESVTSYADYISTLKYHNVNVDTHSDLFSQEYYNYSGFVDFDKLVNYGEYFWLPSGPDSVQVYNNVADTEVAFTVTNADGSYIFNSGSDKNPTLYLAKGGSYTFTMDQPGEPFWIQTVPGLTGVTSASRNVSTREISGLSNNGEDLGTITFNVPHSDAQNDLIQSPQIANPDFATTLTYSQLHNVPLSSVLAAYGGIDNQTEIDGKSLIFVNTTTDETAWDAGSPFDGYPFDSGLTEASEGTFDTGVPIAIANRYDVYDINIVTIAGVATVQLTRKLDWPTLTKVKIKQGTAYGNREFYKSASGIPELVEPYTASLDRLYYQSGSTLNKFGIIELVEIDIVPSLNVSRDIIGKGNYTSANGVVFTNGLKIEFNADVTPSKYSGAKFYVEGIGSPGGIVLVAATDLVTPEQYTISSSEGFDTIGWDAGNFDGTLNSPTEQDYIVINRSSPDLNAWSRTNRWFHKSTIEATATYNNYVATLDQSARARRPIIEYIPGLELFNMGTSSTSPVTVVDTTTTDAFSIVNGSSGYYSDGVQLQHGNTVIFSADLDEDVRKTIYRIDLINQDSNGLTDLIVNLVAVNTVESGNAVLSILGVINQGKQFYWTGTEWKYGQQKTAINQDPLFNIYNPDHVSFGDSTVYTSSTFTGCKLFSYKRNLNTSPDSVLGFGLTYQNFNSIGDIVFENNFDVDTFTHTTSKGNIDIIVRSGHAHSYNASGQRTLHNGWTKVVEQSMQRQIVGYTVNGELYSFEIGAPVDTTKIVQPLSVYVNGKFIYPSEYTHLIQSTREYVVFNTPLQVNDTVVIKFFSNSKSPSSYYEMPRNLENNASNSIFSKLTLGQMRNHIVEISRTHKHFDGMAPGASNIRDLDYKQYPGSILQHSAGLTLPMYLMANTDTSIIRSIKYVKDEYTKFKNRLIDNINKLDLDLTSPSASLDKILISMIGQKNSAFPFYYSDMAAWGDQNTSTFHTIDDITTDTFEFATQFDLTTIGSRSVLVYKNSTLLLEDYEYAFDTVEAKVIFTDAVTLELGDVVKIVAYNNTDGSFIPPTPSKLGLFPKALPQKYIDNSYITPKTVVHGHDGSVWVGYGDIRDDIILEFEKRVYNNIKTQFDSTKFDYADVIPGYFRNTLADFNEATAITRSYFGEWTKNNRVEVAANTNFSESNTFTWNYRNGVDVISGQAVPGHWRGIYDWFYDTDTPHTSPWEMLGLNQKPSWWDARYGVAPYTAGNTVLWEDLRDGKLFNDVAGPDFVILPNRIRPELMSIIPVTEQGALRSPNEFLVKGSYITNAADMWTFSDHSPVETAWKRSSEWPFVLQILAALLSPAKYGTLMFDTNLLETDTSYSQIKQTGKTYRPGIADFKLHGSINSDGGVNRVEGYNQFVSEYASYNRYNLNDIITKINNLQLNLCYSMAGFTDKNYIKVIAESVSPSSTSENIFIPDEDLTIYTKKSAPLERIVYSGVQIIKHENGYEIQGYDNENPFFKVVPSNASDRFRTHTVGETVFYEYIDYANQVANIPYGTVIANKQQVFDFLVCYQRYLMSRGIVFDGTTGTGEKMDFVTSGKEFGFWLNQGWSNGSVLVISPLHNLIKINRSFSTIDNITKTGKMKDANGKIINPKYYDVVRNDNLVEIRIDDTNTQMYSIQIDPVQYEHVLVFNNTTIFNDIVYQPELGNRQNRLKLVGSKSGNWNGTLHAPGFIINEDTIDIWQTQHDYRKGDLVSYKKNTYVSTSSHTSTSVFDYEYWKVADNIQTGLLKNLANKAGQFKNFFDIDTLNLEDGVDRLGKGIIGFNNKEYLQGLGLDDVSQVKFYQGLLKNKGTSTAINQLINANLTNLNQDINYYEEWAFRVGEFGSIDSNQVIEIVVPEQQTTNNPTVIKLLVPGETVSGDSYGVLEKNLYRVPNNYTATPFGTRTTTSNTLNDLDTAGYARLDDVDYTIFSDDQIPELRYNLTDFGKGKKIWIANSAGNTWDIKRIDEVHAAVIKVKNASNGYVIYTTDKNHGFIKDDYIVIRADQPIGRVDKIARVDSPTTFAIRLTGEVDINNIRIPLYKFTSVRFAQPSDISAYTPNAGWENKELVWLDQDAAGKWNVMQHTSPWQATGIKEASGLTTNSKFGKSIAINTNASTAIVGAPDNGYGSILPYVRAEAGPLSATNSVIVTTVNDTIDSFGWSTAAGTEYFAVGAPDTASAKGSMHIFWQDSAGILNPRPSLHPAGLSASDQYGYSTVMSGNGRHLFVGAPGSNTVYAYTLIEITETSKRTYTVTGNTGATYTLNFTPINADALHIVDENGDVYLPNLDWTLSGADITFTSTVANGFQIVVRQMDHFAQVASFTGSGSSSGDKFGYSIDCDYLGRTVVVGAPEATVSAIVKAGEVYVFSQIVQKFIANGTVKSFTTEATLQTKIYVEVNGILQVETENPDIPVDNDGSSGGYYTRTSNTITFKFIPAAGDIIRVYTGSFNETQQLDQSSIDVVTTEERFGESVAVDSRGTLFAIGSPGEDEIDVNTGSVFVFSNAGKNYASVTTTAASYAGTLNDSMYIDDTLVVVGATGSDPQQLVDDINNTAISGVSAVLSGANIIISSTNVEEYNKLTLTAGTGNIFTIGAAVAPLSLVQKINHPHGYQNENFGNKVAFDRHSAQGADAYPGTRNLVISSDKASTLLPVGFDIDTDSNSPDYLAPLTEFDSGSTTFTDKVTQSGAAYAYELMMAHNETLSNPDKFAFTQQLMSTNISELDQFGSAIAYVDNRIIVGALNDTGTVATSGNVYEFNNDTRASGWAVYRTEDALIDTTLINRVALYNKRTGNIVEFLDTIDNAKGKIAGVAQAELAYSTHFDPAVYENNNWGYSQAHKLWWDVSTIHYLKYEQGTIDFRTTYWNEKFPDSSVDVYEWIESDQRPSLYNGTGIVKHPDDSKYTIASVFDSATNSTVIKYYFWVKSKPDVPAEAAFRNISARQVERLIEDPKGLGVAFAAIIDQDAIALYNCNSLLKDNDVVLSINYDVVKNEGILHSEFELFGRGNVDQAVPTRLYNKLIDSISGADAVGNIVPDPYLSAVEKYGVLSRPRQSLFVNRTGALKVLVQYCNKVFESFPVARNKSLVNLNSADIIPSVNSGTYNISVDNMTERNFLNTAIISTGYKVLVLEDETNNGYWSIYSLTSSKTWALTKIQGYNTPDYWEYKTYYAPGYSSTVTPSYQVTIEADLLTLTTARVGEIAKVTSNDEGNVSLYEKTTTGWDEVVIERGTIALSSSLYNFNDQNLNFESTGFDNGGFDFTAFDKIPTIEVRKIVTALKDDIFINIHAINFNELFFRLIEYAMNESEFMQDWAFKTSFISVIHKLRDLDQYGTFKYDNTTFIENFVNDVKPYKTKIREYVSKYDKLDLYGSDTTDFDVHAYYDTESQLFRKPDGTFTGDALLLTQGVNQPWSQNYGYSIENIVIGNAGTGYITNPTVTISAPQLSTGVQATAVAKTNGDSIISIIMTNVGSGYTSNPTVTITGSGTGILVSPRLVNNTVRSFDTTIKFDRITYSSSIIDWTASTSYNIGDIVAYKPKLASAQEVYEVTAAFTSGATFSTEDAFGAEIMTVYADENFTNNADRIAAYYNPTSGMIGDNLELLQRGTGYLANKVTGAGFDLEPGFDQSNFDIGGFDNYEIDADGLTVVGGIDTVIQSLFTDLQLGTRPEDINIDGSKFVDTYNSFAPEELIPGRIYDTLDMEVYTNPSNDYEKDGNGPVIAYTSFTSATGESTFQYGNPSSSLDDYEYIIAYVGTTRQYNFTLNFATKSITIPTPLAPAQTLHVYAYGATGEKMSGEFTYLGDGTRVSFVLGNTIEIAKQTVVFVNGEETTPVVSSQDDRVVVTFTTAPAAGAHIHILTYNQDVSRIAPTKFKLQSTAMATGVYTYALADPSLYAQPYSANTIVEINNVRLRPANSVYHTGNGVATQFTMAKTAGETTIVAASDIGVAIIQKSTNTTLNAIANIDYVVVAGTDYITMLNPPADGNKVIVYNKRSAQYTISGDGTEITINASVAFNSSSVMRINTFTNHDPMRIQTKVFVGQGTGSTTVVEGFDDVDFDSGSFDSSSVVGTIGRYTLDRAVTSVNNFWLTHNGIRLHPGQFTVTGSDVIMSDEVTASLSGTSVLVITHITENNIKPTVGFRIFQHMTGDVEYLRLCKDATTTIAEIVDVVDTKIYVEDASKLPYVTADSEFPGVIFVGSERITYWEINVAENYISNIRRGTGGTAINQRILVGYAVVDGSKTQELPDLSTHTKTWYTLGATTAANGLGLQQSLTANAEFLVKCEAQVPSYQIELNDKKYSVLDYVVVDYVEELL